MVKSRSHYDIVHLPPQCPYQVSTSYTLQFPRYSLDKIFKLKVTTARSKAKSRSHHDVAHLHFLTNVPTKYQLPTPCGFRDTELFPPAHPDTMGENNTPIVLKGCGVKITSLYLHITIISNFKKIVTLKWHQICMYPTSKIALDTMRCR